MMGEQVEDLSCWPKAQGLASAAYHVDSVPSSVMKIPFLSQPRQGEQEAQRWKGFEIKKP
jgi:hypothetical protein